jgi:Kef-type K+ transport system membrane component KefB
MARLGGLDARRSALIGALVNTRGLTELIALNVGYSAGIISGRLFTVLVLMALITTAMTGPLITAIDRRRVTGPAPVLPRMATAQESSRNVDDHT